MREAITVKAGTDHVGEEDGMIAIPTIRVAQQLFFQSRSTRVITR